MGNAPTKADLPRWRWAYEEPAIEECAWPSWPDTYDPAEARMKREEKDEEHTYTLYAMEGRT